MPAVGQSMDGVTEQERDIDLSRKARFTEFIYRLGATARWKKTLFVLLTLVIFRMVNGLDEWVRSPQNFWSPFPRLVRGVEGQTAPPPTPKLGPFLSHMGREIEGGVPNNKIVSIAPTMHESSSQSTSIFDKSTRLGRLTMRLGSIWVVSM